MNTEEQPLLIRKSGTIYDFKTLQKSCAVSNTWFDEIRDSPTLSSEMKFFRAISKEGRN